MFFWFIGLSWLVVAFVFQSPALDYRMVMIGSVVPLLDGVTGGPWILHTLVASVAALGIVMLATRNRRLVRRKWLGVPIGMMVHLVLDGVWTDKDLFWWPAFGTSFGDGRLPELDRGALGLVAEVVGLVALVWGARQFGLTDRLARDRFLRSGQLPRS